VEVIPCIRCGKKAHIPDSAFAVHAGLCLLCRSAVDAIGEARREERERVLGIIEAEMSDASVSYPGVWQAVNNAIRRIRSGAVAEPMTTEEFSKELE
jgi:hypothetical protein